MASNASFDVSTGADLQEVDNAVNQTLKEIAQRYDFKGTHCEVDFDRAKAEIRLSADDEYRMDALVDVLQDQDDQARRAGEEPEAGRHRAGNRAERPADRHPHAGDSAGRLQAHRKGGEGPGIQEGPGEHSR